MTQDLPGILIALITSIWEADKTEVRLYRAPHLQ